MSEQLSIPNPPFVRHSETSREAAERIKPFVLRGLEKVYFFIKKHGPVTDQEIQDGLNMDPSTERPRRGELVERGLVIDSGLKGLTKRKRPATKWIVSSTVPGGPG